MKGQIEQVQEHVVQCGRCPDSVQMHTGRPARMARSLGWSKRKAIGWICPACILALAEQQAARAAEPKRRGFAHPGVSQDRQKAIASQGGKASQASGHGRRWSVEEARAAGRLGVAARRKQREPL
jgi:hypothetical protein